MAGAAAASTGPDPQGLIRLGLVAAGCGVVIGAVAGTFRRLLLEADDARAAIVDTAHDWPLAGWIVPLALVAGCAAFARWVVRLVPLAAGSGVQDVEQRWRTDTGSPPWTVLPAKFIGGLVAIGSGLALGREGPTVHMGAVIASLTARGLRLGRDDERVLQAALGGAGLAAAFNAPLGGSLFVFEEVTKSFRLRLTLTTLIGCATAVAVSRTIVGDHPDFEVAAIATPPGWLIVFYVGFGLVTGALGTVYSRLVLGGLDLFARFTRVPPEVRSAVVGAVVGLALWFEPLLVGGGDQLAQRVLGGGIVLTTLLGYLLFRFAIGPLSYSAGTPGGLFAPLLVVGATWGAVVHAMAHPVIPALGDQSAALAVVGMAAFFAAVVGAPFTGIALIVEMTATTTVLVPMLAASFAAVLASSLLRSEPIYDALRARVPTANH